MKHFIVLFAGLLLPLVRRTTASPAPHLQRRYGDLVVHEKRAFNDELEARGESNLRRRLESDVTLPLRIALKQRNLDALPEYLLSVSDPFSASYGEHWTHERILEAFAPSPKAHETVRSWLVDVGGFEESRVSVSKNGGWVEVVGGATVAEAEGLLKAEYHIFTRDEGDDVVGCQNYSLPAQVAEHVDFVVPTVQPGIKLVKSEKKRRSLARRDLPVQARDLNVGRAIPPGSLTGCDTAVVPACLKTLYNMSYTPKATDRNTFGIVSHYPLTYLQSDLDTFFGNFSPSLVGKSPTLVSINGGGIEVGPTSDVGEDGWILEYAMTLVAPQPVQLLQSGSAQTSVGGITDISFNEWLDAMDGSYCTSQGGDDFTYDPQLPNPFPGGFADHSCGTIPNATRPLVVSNSQAAHEYFFSEFYLKRQCNEFAKLGMMGVTILYAAGNTGVAGQRGYCLDDNGSLNLNGTNFTPNWPASCPWVTVVGGTQVKPSAASSNTSTAGSHPEEVWNQDLTSGFFESSGGGFSNHFDSPAYQHSAVQAYLKALGKDGKGKFNAKGRAYPDLSANANMFVNIDNGAISIDSGTSGATPTVASIITLVNDARISAGKKPVGFINPTIYSPAFANAFNDIVDGTSQGCKGLQGDRGGGFKATKGWDAATGLGTPNLGVLIEKWLALP
ncbi:hypothetical protein M413DRAFT_268272 [Hebeloma cylindrosporum]|uniref:Peptidase S53 domain-containing protein n=1 Tax=Hebeloma cylindrosporum TaxID=76867 RepID=A0A0C2YB35_HEBCY|nr:hypothetical protein M413DRAFT_268272 [Hebeloma cylindrosporum h7]